MSNTVFTSCGFLSLRPAFRPVQQCQMQVRLWPSSMRRTMLRTCILHWTTQRKACEAQLTVDAPSVSLKTKCYLIVLLFSFPLTKWDLCMTCDGVLDLWWVLHKYGLVMWDNVECVFFMVFTLCPSLLFFPSATFCLTRKVFLSEIMYISNKKKQNFNLWLCFISTVTAKINY